MEVFFTFFTGTFSLNIHALQFPNASILLMSGDSESGLAQREKHARRLKQKLSLSIFTRLKSILHGY
jgi:hypothetical protein